MEIIRFVDPNNKVHYGCWAEGTKAVLIEGNIYQEFAVTTRKRVVKKLLPPIVPPAVFGIGLNYMPHVEETGLKAPENPVVFMKNPSSVTAHLADILIPGCCEDTPQVDYEAELAVVIGKPAKNVSESDALDVVLGYTCANDVSARKWQMEAGGGQWIKGKSFDTFCPVGPALVTKDAVPDPGDLTVECRLNGELMQTGRTSQMIFSVARIISFLSQSATLLPGTLILTGTPSGVGFTREPPVFLKSGDMVQVNIPGVGELQNGVITEAEHAAGTADDGIVSPGGSPMGNPMGSPLGGGPGTGFPGPG